VRTPAAAAALVALLAASRASGQFEGQIVNGSDVPFKSPIARSTVAVLNAATNESCSGSLISRHWVALAGHCVTADAKKMTGIASPRDVRVVFGDARFEPGSSLETTAPSRGADLVVLHPDFAGRAGIYGPQRHDVALVRFSGDAPSGFAPARFLNEPDAALAVGSPVTVAGYGVAAAKGSLTALTLRSFDTFVAEFQDKSSVVVLRPSAAHPGGTCGGDSGGPAFVQDASGYLLWGAASAAGVDCKTLAQYEDLRRYRSWINARLGPESGRTPASAVSAAVTGGLAALGLPSFRP
jgi:hypothetical protein